MPLYEYKCEKCGGVFEVRQNFSDQPVAVHADCGGRVERLISTSAFNFKGSGWYVTDYAGKKGGNAPAKGDSEKKSSSDTAVKTESKPADSKSSESKASESKPASSEKSKTD